MNGYQTSRSADPNRPVRPRRGFCRAWVARSAAVWFAVLTLTAPVVAHADELTEFQLARNAYEAQSHRVAVTRFEALVGVDPPRLTNRALILEARKYLAASYLFVGRRADAERQFELLVRADPRYELDPIAFPTEVLDLFTVVRTRLETEIRTQELARLAAEQAQRDRDSAEIRDARARLARLVALARTETIEQRPSRWIATIPFGVGQFQNGNEGLGWAFALLQTAALATSVITWTIHDNLPRDNTFTDDEDALARVTENFLRVTNWIATGAFAALALAGIVEAHFSFRESITVQRQRPIPEGILPIEVRVGIGLGGASLRVQF